MALFRRGGRLLDAVARDGDAGDHAGTCERDDAGGVDVRLPARILILAAATRQGRVGSYGVLTGRELSEVGWGQADTGPPLTRGVASVAAGPGWAMA